MNSKIKEFRFKAAEFANEQKPLGIMKWNEIRDAEFAKLIVKECANLVDQAINDGGIDGLMIKEHFGIEE